jgi:hypothetical protein
MAAIMTNTRFDLNKVYRKASGDALTPGTLILEDGGDGTVYVLNYKLEKQPINFAGFMKYYKASEEAPFSAVVKISMEESSKYPLGSLITDATAPAVLVAPPAPVSKATNNNRRYLIYGVVFIGLVALAWKYRGKLGVK